MTTRKAIERRVRKLAAQKGGVYLGLFDWPVPTDDMRAFNACKAPEGMILCTALISKPKIVACYAIPWEFKGENDLLQTRNYDDSRRTA